MTADEAREDRRLKCIHLFDGECTRNCSSPEQFRPCDVVFGCDTELYVPDMEEPVRDSETDREQ